MPHTVIIIDEERRERAHLVVAQAPIGHTVEVKAPVRSLEQNNRLWAMLSEISAAKPGGRVETPETWKCLFMHSLGWQSRFVTGLDNQPFPVGFSTSKLNKKQFSDLFDVIEEYAARNGIVFKTPIIKEDEKCTLKNKQNSPGAQKPETKETTEDHGTE